MRMVVVQTSSFESFIQLLGVLLIFLFVLGVTYVTTKWIASYEKGRNFNRNLRVIETLKITSNKYIQIVEAGDEYLVIAIGKDEVQLLTKMTRGQLKELPSDDMAVGISKDSFKEILDRVKEHIPKK